MLLALALMLVTAAVMFACTQHSSSAPRRKQASVAAVYMLTLLCWPVLFDTLVGFRMCEQSPMLLLAFVWPYCFLAINMSFASTSHDTKRHHRTNVQMDVNAISGFCFAIGSLLTSQLGKDVGVHTSSIFSTALLMCLAFVMPVPDIPQDYVFAIVLEAFQQSMLHFALALLIAGVSINLTYGWQRSRRNPNALLQALAGAQPNDKYEHSSHHEQAAP